MPACQRLPAEPWPSRCRSALLSPLGWQAANGGLQGPLCRLPRPKKPMGCGHASMSHSNSRRLHSNQSLARLLTFTFRLSSETSPSTAADTRRYSPYSPRHSRYGIHTTTLGRDPTLRHEPRLSKSRTALQTNAVSGVLRFLCSQRVAPGRCTELDAGDDALERVARHPHATLPA